MSGYKEFEGKTLDEAIQSACAYYDTTRDKLEIDILNDAKSGIFGLMGAKKARVRARLVELSSVLEGLGDIPEKGKPQKKRHEPQGGESRRNNKRETRDDVPRKENLFIEKKGPSPTATPEVPGVESQETAASPPPSPLPSESAHGLPNAQSRGGNRSRKERAKHDNRRVKPENGKDAANGKRPDLTFVSEAADDLDAEEYGPAPFDQLDAVELETATREIVSQLTTPFLGEVTISVAMGNDRVRVTLADVEDPGLLIGRDGQTLASLQYLVTRMLSNRMKALLRVQIDAGDYRERQDERLREMALSLAEKVKAGGRPQVTRPLSSYHRRVIHLTLQDDPQIQTHSKGEGEMKRVMVARRKGQHQGPAE